LSIKRFVIVSDEETGWKALYVDGTISQCDKSINIANLVWDTKGEPVILEYKHAKVFPDSDNFPFDISELVFTD
jgi:hypothetical protein